MRTMYQIWKSNPQAFNESPQKIKSYEEKCIDIEAVDLILNSSMYHAPLLNPYKTNVPIYWIKPITIKCIIKHIVNIY